MDLGRVFVKTPGWKVDSGGRLYIEDNVLRFKIEFYR